MTPLEEFLEDVFHACALRAYVDVRAETGQYRPDSETVKRRAYEYFDQEKKLDDKAKSNCDARSGRKL